MDEKQVLICIMAAIIYGGCQGKVLTMTDETKEENNLIDSINKSRKICKLVTGEQQGETKPGA